MTETILDRWRITAEELTQIIDENPSLRGFMVGYIAETKVRQIWFSPPRVTSAVKPDDHDRSQKCDLVVTYKDHDFRIEVKALQMNSIKESDGAKKGIFQCDASDRRTVKLPNGRKVETTCLVVDEFDVVAVSLFGFTGLWDFAFARNRDLPLTTAKKYSKEQKKYLIKGNQQISWPLQSPFVADPIVLFDAIISEGRDR